MILWEEWKRGGWFLVTVPLAGANLYQMFHVLAIYWSLANNLGGSTTLGAGLLLIEYMSTKPKTV